MFMGTAKSNREELVDIRKFVDHRWLFQRVQWVWEGGDDGRLSLVRESTEQKWGEESEGDG